MNKFDNLIWTEKYRPSKIDDCILPEETKQNVKKFVAAGSIPNFLFVGTPGTGKTTLARALCNELNADYLFVNASNESGIDTLRTKILQFASTVSLTDSKKVVLLDEADHLNPNSTQPAFRAFLEEFTNCTFIFTCNYRHRIIDPLQSRLTVVDFKIPKAEMVPLAQQMMKRAMAILDTEKVTYDKKVLAALVKKHFPDFRKTVSELQRYSIGGTIDTGILAVVEEGNFGVLQAALRAKQFTQVRQWVADNTIEPLSFFRQFYDKMASQMIPASVPQLILLIGEFQFRAAHSIDQEINAMAFLIEVMRSCEFKAE